MSEFYGRLQGNRGGVTRCGSKSSGITATVESWTSVVRSVMGPTGESTSYAHIRVEAKYGGTALSLLLDTDTIVENASDPEVRAAINEVAKATDKLNMAARKAQQAELERRGKIAREALVRMAENA